MAEALSPKEDPAPLKSASFERRKSVTATPSTPEVAISDSPKVDEKLTPPLREALGQRRGSLKEAGIAREQARRLSSEAAKSKYKGTNKSIQDLLAKHVVSELKTSGKVIEIDGSLKPEEGFEILLKNNILSAPVYDSEKKEYTGFLDVKDLVASIVVVHQSAKAKPSSLFTMAVTKIGQHGESETEPPSLIYLSRRNPWKAVTLKSTLADVSNILKQKQYHRVPVVDDDGRCIRIVSQSTILQFLAVHKSDIETDTKQPIEDINLGFVEVVCVGSHQHAIDAFQIIDKTGYSGIGVTDKGGKLIGNTSARDIKYFVLDRGDLSLETPVLEYLSAIRQKVITASDKAPICTVKKDATLARVIGLLAATQFHRLFIVDDKGLPTGVISVTDILDFALHSHDDKDKDKS